MHDHAVLYVDNISSSHVETYFMSNQKFIEILDWRLALVDTPTSQGWTLEAVGKKRWDYRVRHITQRGFHQVFERA
jgi:hypothetical protein